MSDPFRSERLSYRAARPGVQEDIDLFQAINDDRVGYVNSNAGNIKLPGPADAERFLKSISEDFLGAVICLTDEGTSQAGTPIGEIHLSGLPPHMRHHRNTEIGIDILPAYQGKGYGSEAVRWALDYAFRRAGLHKVRIRALGWNAAAIKLYERLGFAHEGREREALWHEGRFWDSIEMGMLDREWWALQDEATRARESRSGVGLASTEQTTSPPATQLSVKTQEQATK